MKCKTIHICLCNSIWHLMCREGTLTGHGGTIPDDEIWLKLGVTKVVAISFLTFVSRVNVLTFALRLG